MHLPCLKNVANSSTAIYLHQSNLTAVSSIMWEQCTVVIAAGAFLIGERESTYINMQIILLFEMGVGMCANVRLEIGRERG